MRAIAVVTTAVFSVVCVGCTHDLDGAARPMISVEIVLPTEGEISAAVGNPLSSYGFKPFVGGTDIMPDGFRVDADASPIVCAGVTETMLRVSYERAGVEQAARQSYFTLDPRAAVSGADAAAVRLASDAAAEDLVGKFARDWRACNDQTVVKHLHGAVGSDVTAVISGVADHPMLSATVVTRQGARPQARYLRALARRDSTIVEASLALTGNAAARTRPDAAVAVAQVMLDKVK